jgi:hypothetical protein
MDGLASRIERVLEDRWDGPMFFATQAVLEEIKPAVISMFRVMAQPGIPALTPEQRWDAMMENHSEEEE